MQIIEGKTLNKEIIRNNKYKNLNSLFYVIHKMENDLFIDFVLKQIQFFLNQLLNNRSCLNKVISILLNILLKQDNFEKIIMNCFSSAIRNPNKYLLNSNKIIENKKELPTDNGSAPNLILIDSKNYDSDDGSSDGGGGD